MGGGYEGAEAFGRGTFGEFWGEALEIDLSENNIFLLTITGRYFIMKIYGKCM
jgi:hypothetical protein